MFYQEKKIGSIDWFNWNGEYSTDYGIHVLQQPIITRPKERSEFVEIPGRSGSLTTLEGEHIYSDMDLQCTCVIDNSANLEAISGWLKGSGQVVFATFPDTYYKARVNNQIQFQKVLRNHPHLTFAVPFRCSPFRYSCNEELLKNLKSGDKVLNLGNVPSYPLLEISGAGDISITIGSNTMALTDITDSIIIDNEAKIAYKESSGSRIIQTSHISGEWLSFPEGISKVTYSGRIQKLHITPRWRWL